MAQREIRSGSKVRSPAAGAAGQPVEHVQVDPESSRHLADAEVDARPEFNPGMKDWRKCAMRAKDDELWIQADAALNANAKAFDEVLDATLRLRCRRIGLCRPERSAGLPGPFLLCQRQARRHPSDDERNPYQ